MFGRWKQLVVACAVASIAHTGCNADACQAYETDRLATIKSCGLPPPQTTTQANCPEGAATLANCLDGCLDKVMSCSCWKNPQMPGCAASNLPYLSCTTQCAGSTSSSSASTGSG